MIRLKSKSGTVRTLNRREFLGRLGVGLVTLPLLPSFLIQRAQAGVGANQLLPLIVFFRKRHGGEMGFDMPRTDTESLVVPTQSVGTLGMGTSVHRAALDSLRNGAGSPSGLNSLNRVFGPQWHSEGLLPYLNILGGLYCETPHTPGHGHLDVGNIVGYHDITASCSPTVDAVIAQSEFYRLANARHFQMFGYNNQSLQNETAGNLSSPLSVSPRFFSASEVWNFLFGNVVSTGQGQANSAVLDRILLDIMGLKNNPLLSTGDRQALDAHAERLNTFRSSIAATSCSSPQQPGSPAAGVETLNRVFDMLTFAASSALTCSRPVIASIAVDAEYMMQFADPLPGDYHHDYYHYVSEQANDLTTRRARLFGGSGGHAILPFTKAVLESTFMALARRLRDTSNGAGGNLLDESLLVWTKESGAVTHNGNNMSAYTLGRAGGRLASGYYWDLLDRRGGQGGAMWNGDFYGLGNDPLFADSLEYLGPSYVHVLNTICRAAGLTPQQYALSAGPGGYGRFHQYALNPDYCSNPSAYPFAQTIPELFTG